MAEDGKWIINWFDNQLKDKWVITTPQVNY